MSDRSVRIALSVNAQAAIAGFRQATEAVEKLARAATTARGHFAGMDTDVGRLATSVRNLGTAGGPGLNNLARDLRAMSTAVRNVGNGSGIADLARLATAVHSLSTSASANGLTTLAADLRRIGTAIRSIGSSGTAGLTAITPALHALGSISSGALTTAAADIRRIATAVRQLSGLGGSVATINDIAAALRNLGSAGGGIGNIGGINAQLRHLQDQITALRRAAGNGGGSGGGALGNLLPSGGIGQLASYAAGVVSVGAAVKSTLSAGIDYQNQLNTLQAVTRATDVQMQAVSDTAIKLGNDITLPGTSAADAAVAMTSLAKGGLSVAASMAAAQGTLRLAAAAGTDAATAADIQVNALNAFHLAAGDAGKVADQLANTANSATGEITDFALGLQQSAAVGHQFGFSLTDNLVFLAEFANAGIKGSDAGTSLKSAILALATPTTKQAAAMKTLGVSLYDANGKLNSARTISEQLGAAKKKLSVQEFNTAAAVTFGSDAVRAAAVIADNGVKGFDKYATSIKHVDGAAEVAAAKSKGLGGAIEALKNQAETAQLVLFNKLAPAAEAVVRGFSNAIPQIQTVVGNAFKGAGDFFMPLITGAKDLAVKVWPYIRDFAASVGRGFGSIVGFIKPVVDGIGNFFRAAASNGSVDALGGVLVGIGKAFEGIFKFIQPVGEAIGKAVTWFGNLGPVATTLGVALLGVAAARVGLGLLLRLNFLGLATGMARARASALSFRATMTALQSSGIGRFGSIMGAATQSVANFGRGVLAAFGGPVGLAIVGITSALALLPSLFKGSGKSAEETQADVDSLAASFDTLTGAITDSTKATVADQLVKDGTARAARDLGLDLADLNEAALGSAPAMKRLNDQVGVSIAKNVAASEQYKEIKSDLDAAGISATDLATAVQSGDFTAVGAKWAAYGKTLEGDQYAAMRLSNEQGTLNGIMSQAPNTLKPYTDVLGAAATKSGELSKAQDDVALKIAQTAGAGRTTGAELSKLVGKFRNSADAANHLGTAGAAAGKGTATAAKGIAAAGDAAKTAEQKVHDLSVALNDDHFNRAYGLNFKLDEKGNIKEIFTNVEAGFSRVKQGIEDASTAADIFLYKLGQMTGRNFSKEEEVRHEEAAFRALTGAYRDQQAAAADLQEKKDALAKAQTNLGKTNDDGTAASDATTEADIKAAARALSAAQAGVAQSTADLAQSQQEVLTAGFKVMALDVEGTAKKKGYSAALDVGIKSMAAIRKQYVDSTIAGKQSSMTDDEKKKSLAGITKEANKAADGLGLIPDKKHVTAIINVDNKVALAHAAEARKSVESLVDKYGTIPVKVRTEFNADVDAAKKHGENLYRVYDSTTGTWEAQFLTPGAAQALANAGKNVEMYKKADGTFTARMAVQDEASVKMDGLLRKIDGLKDKSIEIRVKTTGVGQNTTETAFVTNADGTIDKVVTKAAGGGIWGSGPKGVDSVPAVLAPGEHVLTDKDVDAMGGQRAVYDFRKRLHMAEGGAVGSGRDYNLTVKASSPGADAVTTAIGAFVSSATSMAAASGAAAAKAAAAAVLSANVGGIDGALLGSQNPASFGWQAGVGIQPYAYNGTPIVGGVAGGTQPLWTQLFNQIVPTIKGGLVGPQWGFENRDNVNSPGSKSFHAYGLAVDLNAPYNGNKTGAGSGMYQVPPGSGAKARNLGFLWGGEWNDPMHFELHRAKGSGVGSGSTDSRAIANEPMGAGVERWRALATIVSGIKGENIASVQVMLNQMNRESSGNPRAINLTDSNAQAGHPSKGLLQFIDSTFAAYADPGFNTDIYDPASQMHAWYNYINARYGGYEKFAARGYGAYAKGGSVDTVHAMLAPGEHVLTTGDVSAMGGQSAVYGFRQGLHLAKGGAVPGLAARGLGPDAPLPSVRDLAGMIPASLSERVSAVTQGLAGFVEVLKQAWQQFTDLGGVVRDRARDLKDAQHEHDLALLEQSHLSKKATAQEKADVATRVKSTADAERAAQKQVTIAKLTQESARRHAQALSDAQTAERAAFARQKELAARWDGLTTKIAAEKDKLAQMRSDKSSLASSVSGTVQGFDGGLTGHQDTRNNFANLFKGQLYDLAQQTKFVGQLAALKKLGLNSAALADLAGKGVEGGGVTAAALLGGGKAGIANVNLLQSKMKAISDKGGQIVGDAMYANGIRAAEGFVKGLESQQKRIGETMGRVAAGIDGKFKQALKIHSPSQVFASHGENIIRGLAQGVSGGQAAIDLAMSKIHVSVPGSHLISHGPAAGGGKPNLNVRVYVGNREITDIVRTEVDSNNADLARSFAKVGAQQ